MDDSSSEENNYKEDGEDGDEVDGDVSGKSETFLIFSDILRFDLLQWIIVKCQGGRSYSSTNSWHLYEFVQIVCHFVWLLWPAILFAKLFCDEIRK